MNERGRAAADYFKGHGLGNDYLVFEAGSGWPLTPEAIRAVCDRWRGVGSDGIVVVESFARTGLWRSDGSSAGTVQLLEWEGSAVDSYELPDPFGRDEIYHQIP